MDNVTAQKIDGQVKWFDPVKGFGFVVAENGGPDILLHANVLRNFGQSSVADGAQIELLAQETQRGVQAVEILSISAPVTSDDSSLAEIDEFDTGTLDDIPLEPARVKWFDKGKGFGFANIFGREEDVFIHVEVLRRQGLAELQPGEALALRVVEGQRGLMAAQVCPWENATKETS
ncbi:cold-shock protein [Cognatishimia maritima]|uniref:Cold shock protein (Beta-ribbon, CspA family) n=1 Tax=Cognatishimia maritima TaxID=870908 RepID=A0A1M5J6P6_9RHOB|nr:cold shock domain-containing protein [Cognatishimia maritima]SHG36248.1 cold shock protein (beta-ribbon, CspA family) [Cognatishimia maritima]